jgi:hypothetical protein
MKMTDITALGRIVDPRYPTNLAITTIAMIAAVVGAVWRLSAGDAFLASAMWGIGAAFGLFLTWALARELDPDHDLSAFVGVGLALIALLLFEMPSLLLALWLLLMLRLVNRSVGLPARPLDTLAVLGLGLFLTWQGQWLAGLMTAAVFLLDGLLAPPLRYHLLVSGLAFVATGVLAVVQGSINMGPGFTASVSVASAMMSGLFLASIVASRPVRAVGDATGEPLSTRRVQTARALALLTALLFAWWDGQSGMVALSPLWAAMTGIGLYRVVDLILTRRR